jgi:hypothetical protein
MPFRTAHLRLCATQTGGSREAAGSNDSIGKILTLQQYIVFLKNNEESMEGNQSRAICIRSRLLHDSTI